MTLSPQNLLPLLLQQLQNCPCWLLLRRERKSIPGGERDQVLQKEREQDGDRERKRETAGIRETAVVAEVTEMAGVWKRVGEVRRRVGRHVF